MQSSSFLLVPYSLVHHLNYNIHLKVAYRVRFNCCKLKSSSTSKVVLLATELNAEISRYNEVSRSLVLLSSGFGLEVCILAVRLELTY